MHGGIEINKIRILILATLILTLSSCVGAAAEINLTPSDSIQTAVNSAGTNDVINLAAGTYTENIYINNKPGLVIRSSSGSPEDTKIVAANSSTYVIDILNADGVTIQGLNISGGTRGIILDTATNCIIINNVVHSNTNLGIYLSYSDANTVTGNTVFDTANNSINLVFSDNNTISSNIIFNDAVTSLTHGIFLNNSHSNTLQSNTVSKCDYGIAMRYSNYNNLTSNTASENNRGIYLTLTSSTNTLSGNLANSNSMQGIVLDNAGSGNNLVNNTAKLNTINGILIGSSSNNYLTDNDISQNSGRGLYIQSSASGNVISSNTINSNTGSGILLESAGSNNNLTSNTISSNGGYGIYLVSSNNTQMFNNVASSNDKGIYVVSSSGTTITGNNLSYNNAANTSNGIMLSLSNNNTLSGNTAYSNTYGISLNSSLYNTISGNDVVSNSKSGIFLCAQSKYNDIFNNCFNNTQNVDNKNNASTWNTTKTYSSARNIAGGSYLGGNYWATPTNTGYSQVNENDDADGDGLIDTAYNGDNLIDYHPLIEIELVLPTANFSTNVSSGTIPLTVQFTDSSENATSWSWNFGDGGSSATRNTTHTYTAAGNYTVTLTASNENGTDTKNTVITAQAPGGDVVLPEADFTVNETSGYYPLTVLFTDTSQNSTSRSWDVNGDGVEDSTDESFVYTYTSRGTYTATLTARNDNGTDTKTATIYVTRKSSGSSSGGGGGGGSPEPATNVEVKELCQVFITNGKAIEFDFTKNATCVVYVGFDAKKTVGKTTTIAEQLKKKSTLVSNLTEGEVYKYFNVWVGNSGFASSDNIGNSTICFKVEKAWLEDNNIDQDSITLNRYSDKTWAQLSASLLSEDSTYLYYKADVPGYSFFAITGKSKASSEGAATEIEPGDESDNSQDNMGDMGSEAGTESTEDDGSSTPGFEMVCGIVGLSAAFLYRRK